MQCGKLKHKLQTSQKNTSRGWVYRDEYGKRWHRAKCPECKHINDTIYSRTNGHQAIDDIKTGPLARARINERHACRWLVTQGYDAVKLGNGHGPDLTSHAVTFEVKSVVKQSTSRGLFVHAVAPRRRNDDHIIYVYKGQCIMRPMHIHLRECWKQGACNVTRFFRPAGVKRFELKIKEAK
jgi:hypothetical protein